MLTFGSISPKEKIYLADKTLVDPKELKIGDKVLSLKIKQDGINNISDIFENIIDTDNRIIYNYEICEAIVFSAQIEENTNFVNFNNNKIKDSQFIATTPYNKKGIKNYQQYVDTNRQLDIKPFMISNMKELNVAKNSSGKDFSFKIKKINKDFTPDLFNLFKEEEINNIGISNNGISYSLSLLGGHFYFTQNFIVLAEAGE